MASEKPLSAVAFKRPATIVGEFESMPTPDGMGRFHGLVLAYRGIAFAAPG
jgi:hypothetical protein